MQIRALPPSRDWQVSSLSHISWRTYVADLLADHRGEYQRAIDLCTLALAIASEIGYRQVEANALGNIGRAWLASGDANQAAAMLAQAVSIADTIGAVEPALEARSWLAWVHLQLGDAAAALAVTTVERELTFPPEEPAMHMFQGSPCLSWTVSTRVSRRSPKHSRPPVDYWPWRTGTWPRWGLGRWR